MTTRNVAAFAGTDADTRRKTVAALSDEDCRKVLYDWPFWARPNQLPPPGDWFIWLITSGRGWGKTRTGAEFIRAGVESGAMKRVALIGRTAADVRDVMLEGESGLLSISPPWYMPTWEPSKRRVTWPNGAIATTYSADEPNTLRGPQHDGAWADEMAGWRYMDSWDNLLLGLRLGRHPRCVVTTTPRPIKTLKELVADALTHVTYGTTYENVRNLAPTFKRTVLQRYEGTTKGRQEIYGEILSDLPGALWKQSIIDALRFRPAPPLSDGPVLSFRRIVVAIDPAVTAEEDSDETGIIVAGVDDMGHAYVLDDLSGRYHPADWAKVAVNAYHELRGDRVVAEVNNGGDMVELTLRMIDPNVSYKGVHASKGKVTRAEPVAALYEQGRVHHVGSFPELEEQMTTWLPGMASPDRMDALVWALTELLIAPQSTFEVM